jgi:FMN phosphatase YigB (HAD superfamily)
LNGDTSSTPSPFDFAAWLIDLDGTLYRQDLVRSMMALEVALWGRTAIKTLQEFRREHERLHHELLPPGTDPFALQIQRTAQRLEVDAEQVVQAVDEWMFARPGKWLRLFRRRRLLALITEYRSRGGKTAVVSDYPARRKLAAMGIAELVDAVIAAGEPGGPHQLKPNPAGYLLAASSLQISPSRCLVIGDRTDADGEAAHRADMRFQHVAARWPA